MNQKSIHSFLVNIPRLILLSERMQGYALTTFIFKIAMFCNLVQNIFFLLFLLIYFDNPYFFGMLLFLFTKKCRCILIFM